jgi:hypothetical protein
MQNKANKKIMMQGFESGSFGLEYFYLENFWKYSGNFPKRFFPEIFATLVNTIACLYYTNVRTCKYQKHAYISSTAYL